MHRQRRLRQKVFKPTSLADNSFRISFFYHIASSSNTSSRIMSNIDSSVRVIVPWWGVADDDERTVHIEVASMPGGPWVRLVSSASHWLWLALLTRGAVPRTLL